MLLLHCALVDDVLCSAQEANERMTSTIESLQAQLSGHKRDAASGGERESWLAAQLEASTQQCKEAQAK